MSTTGPQNRYEFGSDARALVPRRGAVAVGGARDWEPSQVQLHYEAEQKLRNRCFLPRTPREEHIAIESLRRYPLRF